MNTDTKGTATYSPEDNKLRFYPDYRLDKEEYEQIRSAGFIWAPKQELFVAPAWTPEREDLLLSWCGEIHDEDKSLVDRAQERAARFEDYSESRKEDAEQARQAVTAITEHIPLGQPILVGHHSEAHARRDADRIHNEMSKSVSMWSKADYWASRAASAIRAAKYKERPDVRSRRIKQLSSDRRIEERNLSGHSKNLELWSKFGMTHAEGFKLASSLHNFYVYSTPDQRLFTAFDVLRPAEERFRDCPSMTIEEVQSIAKQKFPVLIERCKRVIDHLDNRIAYEKAMLAESGGTVTDRKAPEKGGACVCWASPRGGWSLIQKVNKASVTILNNWGNGGEDFTQTMALDKLKAVMTKAEVDQARSDGRLLGETKRGFILRSDAVTQETPAAA